jgi:hypothetical protein
MKRSWIARIALVLLSGLAPVALTACGRASTGAARPGLALAPMHTETWAYDDSPSAARCNGGFGASPALVRRWLTFAETNCGTRARKAVKDCHAHGVRYCEVIQYVDANKVWPRNPIRKAPSRESWWLHQPGHTDAAHRLSERSRALGTAYWLDQANSEVGYWIRHYVRSHYSAWDGLMMDDTSACRRTQLYGSGYRSSQEIRSDAGVLNEHRDLARLLTHPGRTPFIQVDNGIQPNPYICSALRLLNDRLGVRGLIAEGAPWGEGFSAYYSDLLDVVAAVDAEPNDFIVLLSYAHKGLGQARRVQEATVMLGYEAGHVVSWADLEQENHHLAVWPEEGIYPTQPLQSMGTPGGPGCLGGRGQACASGGHNDLRVAGGSNANDPGAGVYRREFGMCYDGGIPFGPCAAIVNDTSKPVVVQQSWLTLPYGHEITLQGGDVQSGGKIDLTGGVFTAGTTSIGADDAILIAN